MKLQDILSEAEIEQYHQDWNAFKKGYSKKTEYIQTPYNVHSGIPVISKIFRFEDKPIFRTHVFQKRLRRIDPSFLSDIHLMPHWHIVHYSTAAEQIYHASIGLIRDSDRFCAFEVPLEMKLSNRTFWNDKISIEMIWKPKRKTREFLIEDCHISFYDDETNEAKNMFSIRTFVRLREYAYLLEKLKYGEDTLVELTRRIESREKTNRRLIKPRKNLKITADYLIDELRKGNMAEEELHDFFSFWDKQTNKPKTKNKTQKPNKK